MEVLFIFSLGRYYVYCVLYLYKEILYFSFLGVNSSTLGFSRASCLTEWLQGGDYENIVKVPPPNPKKLKNPEIPILEECNKYFFFLSTTTFLIYFLTRHSTNPLCFDLFS